MALIHAQHRAWPAAVADGQLFAHLLPWLLALVALVAVGTLAIYLARRWTRPESDSADGFTLHGLRELHASGQLTDEEFERAKAAMIGRVQRSVKGDETPDGSDAAQTSTPIADNDSKPPS